MNIEFIILASAIIQIVVLFMFFILSSNVSSIRNKLTDVDISRDDKFDFYVCSGQLDNARDMLSKMILSDNLWERVFDDSPSIRDESRLKILNKYKSKMEAVGLILDFSKRI
nr:MAG TPA: hypothetical protein [Caudoviricetes sp.]